MVSMTDGATSVNMRQAPRLSGEQDGILPLNGSTNKFSGSPYSGYHGKPRSLHLARNPQYKSQQSFLSRASQGQMENNDQASSVTKL